MKEKFSLHAAVFVLFEKDNKVLLMRRYNTGWQDGNYTLPAGHFDGGETVKAAAVREMKEEIGIDLTERDLDIVHILHIITNFEYITFFLKANNWSGQPTNTEPEKCDDLQWFDMNNLPENIVPFIGTVIESYKKGIMFSEIGFEKDFTKYIA